MLRWLRNLSLGPRIIAIVAAPLAGLLGLAAIEILAARDNALRMDQVAELTELAPRASSVLHELQIERGASAGFIKSQGETFTEILAKQRPLVDARAAELLAAFAAASPHFGDEATLRSRFQAVRDGIDGLRGLRAEVDGVALSPAAAVDHYNRIVETLMGVISGLAQANQDATVARDISAFLSFQHMKDAAALEKATGAVGFADGAFTFPGELIPRLSALIVSQEIYFKTFEQSATEAAVAAYTAAMQSPIIAKIETVREFALSGHGGDLSGSVTGASWFEMTSERINLMKTADAALTANLQNVATNLSDAAWSDFRRLTAAILAVLVVTLLVTTAIIRSIIRPLGGLTAATQRFAAGDQNVEIPGAERGDEIGILASAINAAKINIAAMAQMRREQAEAAATADARHRAEMIAMADSFEQSVIGVVDTLAHSADEMQASAAAMQDAAAQASGLTIEVEQTSRQAAANVQAVASATEELNASVREISRRSADTSAMSQEAVTEAGGAQDRFHRLNDASQRIGDVVSLINDIAEQTNLLALNATIEAARAGEAGKGFAVVAAEVKSLANQTANATGEIGDQVKRMQQETESAVQVIEGISGAIGRIHEIALAVSTAADQQSAATAEISANVQEAASGAQHADESMSAVRSGAESTGANASQVLSAAQALNAQSACLRGEVSAFLDKVRAG